MDVQRRAEVIRDRLLGVTYEEECEPVVDALVMLLAETLIEGAVDPREAAEIVGQRLRDTVSGVLDEVTC